MTAKINHKECQVCVKIATEDGSRKGYRELALYNGLWLYHWTHSVGFGVNVGNCLTRYSYKTFCGIEYTREVDSSD